MKLGASHFSQGLLLASGKGSSMVEEEGKLEGKGMREWDGRALLIIKDISILVFLKKVRR